ncbi:FERM domain-containing protein 8 [Borealophlyctis nickersoniae]|nr:FERM domain-containing protein 8 [Borealophlyctis nickersoniae]
MPTPTSASLPRTPSTDALRAPTITRKSPAKAVVKNAPEAARESRWAPPLQRHAGREGVPPFITICVRVLSGDAEHDFNAKFVEGELRAQKVCDAIASKEGLSGVGASLFALWIVGKDLEIQLRPDLDIFEVMKTWHLMVLEHTHFPEAMDCFHPINRHWFVYRREATVPKVLERRVEEDAVVRLLYGEDPRQAKRNVMTGRYLCTPEDASILGGMLLQGSCGDYDPLRHRAGYLMSDDFYKSVLPLRVHDVMKPKKWEALLQTEHAKNRGRTPQVLRQMYLEHVRRWACYGCSFFPVCKDKPPHGFFEFRLQQMQVGIGTEGVVILDMKKGFYMHVHQWPSINWTHASDKLIFVFSATPSTTSSTTPKREKVKLYTPQSRMIHNLALRCKYLYYKRQYGSVSAPVSPVGTPDRGVSPAPVRAQAHGGGDGGIGQLGRREHSAPPVGRGVDVVIEEGSRDLLNEDDASAVVDQPSKMMKKRPSVLDTHLAAPSSVVSAPGKLVKTPSLHDALFVAPVKPLLFGTFVASTPQIPSGMTSESEWSEEEVEDGNKTVPFPPDVDRQMMDTDAVLAAALQELDDYGADADPQNPETLRGRPRGTSAPPEPGFDTIGRASVASSSGVSVPTGIPKSMSQGHKQPLASFTDKRSSYQARRKSRQSIAPPTSPSSAPVSDSPQPSRSTSPPAIVVSTLSIVPDLATTGIPSSTSTQWNIPSSASHSSALTSLSGGGNTNNSGGRRSRRHSVSEAFTTMFKESGGVKRGVGGGTFDFDALLSAPVQVQVADFTPSHSRQASRS